MYTHIHLSLSIYIYIHTYVCMLYIYIYIYMISSLRSPILAQGEPPRFEPSLTADISPTQPAQSYGSRGGVPFGSPGFPGSGIPRMDRSREWLRPSSSKRGFPFLSCSVGSVLPLRGLETVVWKRACPTSYESLPNPAPHVACASRQERTGTSTVRLYAKCAITTHMLHM